ncbi:AbrB family transcriptional regulator [Pseudoduganella violaceinigra]|uniref:AbrB family transcriptional regulator n=1 Tax=Pseudoduganella violaceinigra TaxID=246602 RepID=UPI0004013B4E|nr:AbrB family transcriptional regulator [Pseudoduganella violaceinigra]
MGFLSKHRGFLQALAAGLLAASFCRWLDTPLPWLIGPLFASAALRMAGADLRCPVAARAAGQWAIGTVLGLYFTPAVLAVVAARAGYIAAALAFALALGALCAWLLKRLAGVSTATAFFAMALGGASEMAVQGERHGAEAQHVAAAQGVRLMMVVSFLPFVLRYWSGHGMPPSGLSTLALPAQGPAGAAALPAFAMLAAASCAAGWLLWRCAMPNAWVLGPLFAAALLAAAKAPVGGVPEWMVRAGQLCIGLSLGTRFTPGFLHAAPRYMAAVGACTAMALGLAALFGLALATCGGLHPATAMLATSPGGIAEMALTARALHAEVPVVTAFHVCRMVVLVLAVGPVFRNLLR